MITAADIARVLDLAPHPEGGFYRETHRAGELVMTARGPRAASSAILFLVTADSPSRFHRLANDELWFYHGGSRLELTTLLPDGRVETIVLAGAGLLVRDEELTPQAIVPGGVWQAARVAPGEGVDWTLVSCVVTPAFDFEDFELADPDEISAAYPDQAGLIAALSSGR
jgi:uncharacterized protein